MSNEAAATPEVTPPASDRSAPDAGAVAASARSLAARTARQTADTIEQNPLGVIVGGLAVGVLAGSLIPKSSREKALLAPIGKRLAKGARGAISAAREAATAELSVAGISRAAARDQIRKLAESVVAAARSASDAAKAAAREAAKPNAGAAPAEAAQAPTVEEAGKTAA